jgi:calcium permeable stress-gated cation channel
LPTIRTSEFTVLQIVGLDAAVVCNTLLLLDSVSLTHKSQLLNFLKMSFYLFSTTSVLALCILMPANYHVSIYHS